MQTGQCLRRFERARQRCHMHQFLARAILENLKACSNEANMLVQHHPTLLDATCWPRLNTMLEDVGLILNLLKISSNIIQHCSANNVA